MRVCVIAPTHACDFCNFLKQTPPFINQHFMVAKKIPPPFSPHSSPPPPLTPSIFNVL